MSDQSKIKSKIAALLAKAKGTDNEHEAEAFLAKAQELLEQHQLALGDLEDASDPIKHSQGLDGTKWVASWQRDLFRALGKLYGCESVRVLLGGTKYRQELVGRESAIITTELMFDYTKAECNRLGRELYAKRGAESPAQGARLVGNALVTRIWTLVPKDDAPRTEAATKNALVTRDAVLAKVDEIYGKLTHGRATTRRTSGAARELAGGIGLHRQAGGSSALRIGGR